MTRDAPSLLPGVVRTSYAARLGVALAVAVVVMVGFGAVISAQASTTLQDDVEGDLTTLSETRTDQIDAWLGAVQREVVLVSQQEAVTSGDADRVDEYIEQRVDREQVPANVVAVHYLNTETMVFDRSTSERMEGISPAEQGAPFATDPPSFDSPDETYVTQPFRVPVVDHPIIAVSRRSTASRTARSSTWPTWRRAHRHSRTATATPRQSSSTARAATSPTRTAARS